MKLQDLGWNDVFDEHFIALENQDWQPARVARADGKSYRLLWADGELRAELAGRLRHEANLASELPAVGDWVAMSPRPAEGAATIHAGHCLKQSGRL